MFVYFGGLATVLLMPSKNPTYVVFIKRKIFVVGTIQMNQAKLLYGCTYKHQNILLKDLASTYCWLPMYNILFLMYIILRTYVWSDYGKSILQKFAG